MNTRVAGMVGWSLLVHAVVIGALSQAKRSEASAGAQVMRLHEVEFEKPKKPDPPPEPPPPQPEPAKPQPKVKRLAPKAVKEAPKTPEEPSKDPPPASDEPPKPGKPGPEGAPELAGATNGGEGPGSGHGTGSYGDGNGGGGRPAPPPPPKPAANKIYSKGEVDAPAHGCRRVSPSVPLAIQRSGRPFKAAVKVRFIVTSSGNIAGASVVKSRGDAAFRDSSLQAIRRWHCKPAMVQGTPVSQWATKVFRFRPRKRHLASCSIEESAGHAAGAQAAGVFASRYCSGYLRNIRRGESLCGQGGFGFHPPTRLAIAGLIGRERRQ